MAILDLFKSRKREPSYKPSALQVRHHRNFVAAQNDRLLNGWLTQSSHINKYLQSGLVSLRARSRDQVRNNPYGRRFVSLNKSNIVGPDGVVVQAQTVRKLPSGQVITDAAANDAIEASWYDWIHYHADISGMMSFIEMQAQGIGCAATDGEFLFRKHYTGKYGFQLEAIDTERLDITRNQQERNGNFTRLGVEYNGQGRPVRYWFRKISHDGDYYSGEPEPIGARYIIHGYIHEWVGQARGIPWLAASLFSMKMLDGYDEAAITAARIGASKMGFYKNPDGQTLPGDDKDSDGNLIAEVEPGMFEQLPAGYDFQAFDPNYPHEQYPHFHKACERRISSGADISYNSLSNDLEGVNYSSIRAGVLEDRELFKQRQNWLIRTLIKPVYEEWISNAVLREQIKIGKAPLRRPVNEYFPAKYQARRWSWVDPQKDMNANQSAIELGITSRSAVIRDRGDDPETVWREIQKEKEIMAKLGIDTTTGNGNGQKISTNETDKISDD